MEVEVVAASHREVQGTRTAATRGGDGTRDAAPAESASRRRWGL